MKSCYLGKIVRGRPSDRYRWGGRKKGGPGVKVGTRVSFGWASDQGAFGVIIWIKLGWPAGKTWWQKLLSKVKGGSGVRGEKVKKKKIRHGEMAIRQERRKRKRGNHQLQV